ncbi:unannotated protein [freshwater metagenome]|uniref:Unannotated protein n=1 Tax=freshwater metagenome TaxID=449393 RepID=A0A6J6VRJ0_9ZZZZ
MAIAHATNFVCLSDTVGPRKRSRCVRILYDVMRALGTTWVPRDTSTLAQEVETIRPTGQDFMNIRLVTGIKEDGVFGRVKNPMDRDRQFNHAQVGPEMATTLAHGSNQEFTNLAR